MEKQGKAVSKDQLYGILETRNIEHVQFGLEQRFPTWYGSTAYFQLSSRKLGVRDPDGRLSSRDLAHVGNKSAKIKVETQLIQKSNDIWLDTLYVCEYCFKYTDDASELQQHVANCPHRRKGLGRLQYRSPDLSIRKVHGKQHTLFCQCLCLFTKLFLDNKSMYFKVDHYDFYIAYEAQTNKPMAFFSKDLISYQKNNLACILTLPPYQRRGLGTLLMEFSYKLSIREGLISGPELPLSPFGLVSYLKFWSSLVCNQFIKGNLSDRGRVSLDDISQATGMRAGDILQTLKSLKCLTTRNEISLHALRQWTKDNKRHSGTLINDDFMILDD
ncbi:LANO_0H02652g1_1 [Lachancea nothofagi CBS 11611]|uniref:histone acetyltransferase n=1 Tax=Lachancea nothofagi CBS 11611 TaxID=1266666 RepID=A0A1G4KL47_9SACH|nr:LANO_0H02652g1_1 [Lachancea nothofagi CBS 11611]